MIPLVNLHRNWQQKVEKHPTVTGGAKKLAEAIVKDAQGRTVARTGKARASIKVAEGDGEVYVTAGQGDAWYIVFQEVGGRGFRSPPMPIRRAASKYGIRTSKER